MKTKAFTLVEVMIVIIIIGLLLAMAIPACQRVKEASSPEYQQKLESEQRALYSVWKRAHNSDLTFEEWQALRKNGMLPK